MIPDRINIGNSERSGFANDIIPDDISHDTSRQHVHIAWPFLSLYHATIMNESNPPSTGQNGQSSPIPTVESLPNINELQQAVVKPTRGPFITKENAKALQLKAVESKARLKAERAAIAAKVDADTEMLRPLLAKAVELATGLAAVPEQEYKLQQIAHTRAEIEACRKAMESLRNGPARDYKAMSDALWRLREIERHLAGWPGPGNRQPSKERVAPASTTAEPL